jgi:hypothetical protein
MSDIQDPLSQLWQGQTAEQPDIQAITKKWRWTKVKQRLYVCLDLLSVVIPFVLIWQYMDELDIVTKRIVLAILLLSIPFVVYLTWLRRFSLGWSSESTEKYIQQLQKQLANNSKIAFMTKHSIWPVLVLIGIQYIALFYYDIFPIEKLIHKAVISSCIVAVVFIAVWIWADKRQKRFDKELLELNNLLDGTITNHHK